MENKRPQKYLDDEAALERMRKYCAYQERCHKEVRSKLIELEVYGDRLEAVIVELIAENFLNEERFARMYARGKFNIKKWGRQKITSELKFRRISAYCIKKAMTEIDDEDYYRALQGIITKKFRDYRSGKIYIRNQKVYKYCYSRGYESPMISQGIKDYWAEQEKE